MSKNKVVLNQGFQIVNGYEIREENLNGSNYYVVPVVMMVEGVHSGSRGPLLYSSNTLAESVPDWPNIPVTIHHPTIMVSEVGSDAVIVGHVNNPFMQGDSLRAEAWLNVDQLTSLSPETLQIVENQRPLEVSIGVYGHEVQEAGEWHGETYRAITEGMVPDHLALLPGDRGACSWDDGCGIRNEENKSVLSFIQNGVQMKKDKLEFLKNSNKEKVDKDGNPIVLNALKDISNEVGFKTISRNLQRQLDNMDDQNYYYFLEELFDETFVYRQVNRNDGSEKYYRQGYSVNQAQNEITVSEADPTQVRKNVSYEEISNQQEKNSIKLKRNKMSKQKNAATPCTVNALIQNESTRFTEEDREWLESMTEEQASRLAPVENAQQEEEEQPKPTSNKETVPAEITPEQIKSVLNSEKDPAKFINNFMPDGIKGQMLNGLKMYNNARKAKIDAIVKNSKFTEEQLNSWSDDQLDTLHQSVVNEEPEVDYSLNGIGNHQYTQQEESLVGEEEMAMLNFGTSPDKKEEDNK